MVIGILIALSINTWNQSRIDRKRAYDYHQRLLEDMDRIIERSKSLNDRANTTLRAISQSVLILENRKISSEEERSDLNYAILWSPRFNYQLPDLSTLEEMKSNGDLKLIYDVRLRKKMVDFNGYLYSVKNVFQTTGATIQMKLSYFDKYIRSYVDPENLEVRHTYDFDKIASDNEFINHFSELAIHWRGSSYFTGQITKQAIALKEDIEKEIKNFDD